MGIIYKNGVQYGGTVDAANMHVDIGSSTLNLQTAIQNITGNVAPIETNPTTNAYAIGDLLVFNGILYKATATIAAGTTLVIGTNIVATSINNQIDNKIDEIAEVYDYEYTGTYNQDTIKNNAFKSFCLTKVLSELANTENQEMLQNGTLVSKNKMVLIRITIPTDSTFLDLYTGTITISLVPLMSSNTLSFIAAQVRGLLSDSQHACANLLDTYLQGPYQIFWRAEVNTQFQIVENSYSPQFSKVELVRKPSIVNNATTDSANRPVSAAVAKSLQDQITTVNTNLPLKVTKINFDIAATANTYETVATFTLSANKSYLICASAFYSTGQPTGIKLLFGSTVFKTVESSNYADINFVYPLLTSQATTVTIQDKRATTGRHTGTVLIFEIN